MDHVLSLIGDWAEASPRNTKIVLLFMVLLFPFTLALLAYRILTEGWLFLVWRYRVDRAPSGWRQRRL